MTHNIAPALEEMAVPISDLELLPGNPRQGDIGAISMSLEQFGQRYPIVVKDGVVVAGNHRLMAAQMLGWSHIAVVDASDLSDEQIKAFALADNRTGDLGTYDEEALIAMLSEVAQEGEDLLLATGFDGDDLDDLIIKLENEDASQYSSRIFAPVYEPSGPQPLVDDLYDQEYTSELVAEIDAADIPDDLRQFLIAAAERHTAFRYDRIANYYAHAPAEIQRLMERSALVIIDFDKALEYGFVQTSKTLADIFAEEYPQ